MNADVESVSEGSHAGGPGIVVSWAALLRFAGGAGLRQAHYRRRSRAPYLGEVYKLVYQFIRARSSGRDAMTCTVSRGEIEVAPRRDLGLRKMAGYPACLLVRGTMPPATGSSRVGRPRGGA
jgi:hypothetical protein